MPTELPCNDCNCIFSNEISFKIHLKNCLNNINNNTTNKYYCPACNRYFRFLPNLLRHSETKKHLDLINWNIKQLSNNSDSINLQTNIKNVFITKDIIEKEDINEDIKENVNIEKDFLISNSNNNNLDNVDIKDDFLSQLQESYNTSNTSNIDNQKSNLELQINDNLNDFNLEIINNSTPNKEIKEVNNINDDFLENLIKEREKIFNSLSNPTSNTNKETKFNFDFKIETNENLNLKDELNQLKLSITNNSSNNSSNNDLNDDFLNQIQQERQKKQNQNQNIIIEKNKTNIPDKKQQIQNNNIIDKRQQPQQNIITKEKEIKENEKQKERYPIVFKTNNIWKKLVNMVPLNNIKLLTYNVVLILSSYNISYFPIVCAFVLFSEDLDNKKEMRLELINSLLEIEKHLIKLIQNRKFIWNNNKNTLECYNFFNKLKLKEQYKKYF